MGPEGQKPGVMIPIPQYPLYSATLAEFNMHQIGYYLNEDRNWAMDMDELERALAEAKQTCDPKAIVIINPGNPTGSVLSRENIENVVKFSPQGKALCVCRRGLPAQCVRGGLPVPLVQES